MNLTVFGDNFGILNNYRLIDHFKSHFSKNLKLAYPVMLSHLGQMLVHTADNIMVGRIGKEPLAGASFANSIFVIFLIFGIGLSYAITPQTAQADGKRDTVKLAQVLKHGITISGLSGIVLFAAIFFNINHLKYFNQPEEVYLLAQPYLRIIAFSIIPFMVFQAFRQFAEGLGYTKQAMYITLLANFINIVLNYILIFGKLGFDPMGLNGAGIATLISRIIMAVLMASFVYFDGRFKPYWHHFRNKILEVSMVKKFMNLGLPMALQLIFEVSTFSLAAIMMGWLGTEELAAHQITISLASITYMAAMGIAAATTIRVGNQLGRRDIKTLREAAFTSFIMAIIFMSFAAIIFIFGRNFLPILFIDDMEVRNLAGVLLIVAGLFQISDGIQAIGLGSLRGLSDVKVPTIITLIAYWLVGLPVGYILGFTFELGAVGIWIGLLFGLSMAAVLLFRRFNRKTKKMLSNTVLPLDSSVSHP